MNDETKLKYLGDMQSLIRRMDQWADEKLSSGVPPSGAECETIAEIRALLAKVKCTLAEWKVERNDGDRPSA